MKISFWFFANPVELFHPGQMFSGVPGKVGEVGPEGEADIISDLLPFERYTALTSCQCPSLSQIKKWDAFNQRQQF